MNDLVVSRDLAERIVEAGFLDATNFCWVQGNRANTDWHVGNFRGLGESYSAPTAQEMTDAMPSSIQWDYDEAGEYAVHFHGLVWLGVRRVASGKWQAGYYSGQTAIFLKYADKMVDALALLWLSLRGKDITA